ncbi:ABC transporter permease [Paeniglutamicibacter psychrophenolicus]|uniref:Peptide/nickel transport system permease protein n=1 Tax=Paeniglutamicibacter psychrophenolicus TaxID=257454 RepID=A0ABS4WAD4_9MICC|nr:ABC transporter permease [Paeniglutamicibacter psychrophenolicus]MBP2372878.1 peptide/nickel transport system permease protein [Paeniglutamicibacter psychrophenolicus]
MSILEKAATTTPVKPVKQMTPRQRTWSRFFKGPLGFISLGTIVALVLVGIFGPMIVPYPEGLGPNVLQPPSSEHWFGTDGLGLDVLGQIVWGTRTSLGVALFAGIIAIGVGVALGILAAYFKRADSIITTVTDVMLSLPILPLMIVVTAMVGPSIVTLTLVIGFFSWPEICRLIRSNALVVVSMPFVDGARAIGASSWRIMFKEILPMVSPLLIVMGLLTCARAVISEASLSFLGLGDPSTWSWGRILQSAQRDGVLVSAWWQTLFPSIVILLLVLSASIVGTRFNDSRSVKFKGA